MVEAGSSSLRRILDSRSTTPPTASASVFPPLRSTGSQRRIAPTLPKCSSRSESVVNSVDGLRARPIRNSACDERAPAGEVDDLGA